MSPLFVTMAPLISSSLHSRSFSHPHSGLQALAGKGHQKGACVTPAMLPETERAELVSIKGFSMTALVVRALPDLDTKPIV